MPICIKLNRSNIIHKISIQPDPKTYPPPADSSTHIEVTATATGEHGGGLGGLQVRRGSEPSLNQLTESTTAYSSPTGQNSDPTKRWSAAPVCRSDTDPPERLLATTYGANGAWLPAVVPEEDQSHLLAVPATAAAQHGQTDSMSSNFSRSGRLSMQFLGNDG